MTPPGVDDNGSEELSLRGQEMEMGFFEVSVNSGLQLAYPTDADRMGDKHCLFCVRLSQFQYQAD